MTFDDVCDLDLNIAGQTFLGREEIMQGSVGMTQLFERNQFLASQRIELRDMRIPGRGDRLGWRVMFLGDVDGVADTDEIAVSAPMADQAGENSGTVYVIAARGALPVGSFDDPEDGIAGAKVIRLRGATPQAWFGFSLAAPGNVVGDSTKDLIVGAPSGPRPSSGKRTRAT